MIEVVITINDESKLMHHANLIVETHSYVYHSIGIFNPRYSEVNIKVECNLLVNSMRLHSKLDLNLICNQSMFSLRKQF